MTPQQFRDGVRVAVYLSVIAIYITVLIVIIASLDDMSNVEIIVSTLALSTVGYLIFTQL